MPGIAGIISKTSVEANEASLDLMLKTMLHEDSYVFGKYTNKKMNLHCCWVTHKNSLFDCLPIMNEAKDTVLIFSGENFEDQEAINHLRKKGHDFDPSNGSYVIHMYEDIGESFLELLNGWFSGILIDTRVNKITLFNDRYGMGRIYVFEGKDEFLFSSEAKAILKVRPETRTIDNASLGEYFVYGCTLNNKSLFSSISILPGGSKYEFHDHGRILNKKCYFSSDSWEAQPKMESDEFIDALTESFAKILPKYFYSRDPIAMSLTGGLDTRMILASFNMPPESMPCYTFGGAGGDTLDVRIAQNVAAATSQPHRVLRLGEDFFAEFPHFAEKTVRVSDGCFGVCGSHEVYLNGLAKDLSATRLTGFAGSEVLRRARVINRFPPNKECFHPDFNSYINDASELQEDLNKHQSRLSNILFKEIPWGLYGSIVTAQSQLTYRTPYMDNELIGIIFREPNNYLKHSWVSVEFIKKKNSKLFGILTDRGLCGNYNFVFSKLIHLYYEYIFKIEYRLNEGLPDWLSSPIYRFPSLKIDRLLFSKHKYLFYREWFRNKLAGYMKEVMLDRKTARREYLNRQYLETIVQNHIRGNRNYLNEINKIISVELIRDCFIEQ